MEKIHTHYDNLKVTRNAPTEVIRAAYKSLSQKYHPDRHPDNAGATRVMAIINGSYEVLSDPIQRAAHDDWIAEEEQSLLAQQAAAYRPAPSPPLRPQPPTSSTEKGAIPRKPNIVVAHLVQYWVFYLMAGLLVTWLLKENKPRSSPSIAPYQNLATTPPTQQSYSPPQVVSAPTRSYPVAPTPLGTPPAQYIRPSTAPNAQPWPTFAGYVRGYAQLNNDGLSSVTIDNSQNDSDVFVKLISDNGINAFPVRQFFIPARNTFKVEGVTAGNYDVRYRDLTTGALSRSEPFLLREIVEVDRTRYSTIRMTLYKVRDGNMKTFGLTEDEFGR